MCARTHAPVRCKCLLAPSHSAVDTVALPDRSVPVPVLPVQYVCCQDFKISVAFNRIKQICHASSGIPAAGVQKSEGIKLNRRNIEGAKYSGVLNNGDEEHQLQWRTKMCYNIHNEDEKPTGLPFALLEEITDNFSKERKFGHSGFGEVYQYYICALMPLNPGGSMCRAAKALAPQWLHAQG